MNKNFNIDDLEIDELTGDLKILELLDNYIDKKDNNNESIKTKSDNICNNCNGTNLTNNNISIICKDCGTVNKELLDRGIEYNNDMKVSRIGCQTNHFYPLSCMGTKIGGNKYMPYKTIHNEWNRMVYREHALLIVNNYIEKIGNDNNIPKIIIDNAQILYKKINDSKHRYGKNKDKQVIVRGLNRHSLIAACIYHGAELQGVPRDQKEIAEMCKLDPTDITRGCRKFREILEGDDILRILVPSDAMKYFLSYSQKINLSKEYIDICRKLNINIKKLNIASDHQPPSIAIGSIMLVSEKYNLNLDIKEISKIVKKSIVTIKKTHLKLKDYIDILFDDKKVEEEYQKHLKYIENIENYIDF
tara:strand:+ start:1181 stop:2260 length:1080 start_codon:yes stop_codon:yes gene_type:complete